MAKKNMAASAGDRLAAALVPAEEQPYQVPENWCWCRFGSLASNQYGYTAKAVEDNAWPKILRITDIQDGCVDWETVPNCVIEGADLEKYLLRDNDIVIARIGATTGKSFLVRNPENAVFASYLIRIRFADNLLPEYVYLFLQSDIYWAQISELSAGIALPGVNSSKLLTMMFPLPPLAEQHRIVARITSLFAELDVAKEEAQAIIDDYEDRKTAILHRAFTGELTEEWRKENKILLESWNTTPLINLCTRIFDGPFGSNLKSDDYVKSGIRVVRLENLKNLWFDDSKQSFVTEEKYNSIAAHTVFPSDLIMSTFIADEIKVCQMPEYIGYAVNKADCIGIRVADSVDKLFVLYYLSSKQTFNFLFNQLHGATRPRVNTKQIKAIPVPLPTLAEQHEIVRRLDSLLSQETATKEAAEETITQIATLRQSILARAFRGELGTNDPTDEPAIELLKRTLL